ncbi:MAG TPA: MXAN_6640 family putative metalloprotease [Actinomycetota bacterium]|nr:MXAN_6640 family putative metalloprotease [Actinomycetota bacterium]
MKRPVAMLVLLAIAVFAAAPASAGRRGASLRRGLDLSLDEPVRIPDGAKLTRATAALSSVTDDALSRSLLSGRITPAQFALRRVQAAFDGTVKGVDLSLLLADLALRVRDLRGAERNRALDLLARPTQNGPDNLDSGYSYRDATTEVDCGTHFCVHWAEDGRHRINLTDGADENTLPDYVDAVHTTMEEVWAVEVDELGFDAPKSDVTSENDDVPAQHAAKLDVYLLNSGADGVYGYCGTDDPNLVDPFTTYPYWDGSSYCALDNDFAPSQFGGAPAAESLQVTAAHEFFHAIQLGYSAGHDSWMSEGTAALLEDVVYDAIDDNYQYLSASSLRQPNVPLNRNRNPYHYGAWLFWRYLTELPSAPEAPAIGIDVIRETWELAAFDGPAAPRLRSTFAVTKALGDRDISFANAKAFFSTVNFVPHLFYEEGAAYRTAVGGKAPPAASFTLGGTRKKTGTRAGVLDHLTSAYVAFKPGAGVSNLRVAVDLPAAKTAPRATLLIMLADGTARHASFEVDSTGFGLLDLNELGHEFTSASVQRVVLVLDNASTRMSKCQQVTPWSCGKPLDDDLQFAFAAQAS